MSAVTEIIKSPQSHEDAGALSIESGIVEHAWNLYRRFREGRERERKQAFAPMDIERGERASITFFCRATPFTSVKLIRQRQSVIHQPARSRSREGKSDMEALVGSLRAVCCPCGRASQKPWRKQIAVGLVDCEYPPRQHEEKILLCMFFSCKMQLCFPSSANLNCSARRSVEKSVLLGNVWRQKPRRPHFLLNAVIRSAGIDCVP